MTQTNDYWLDVCPDGWKHIVNRADAMLKFIDPNYQIAQIKEKFGELRYYVHPGEVTDIEADIIHAITNWAEGRSRHVCMECGKYGRLRDDHYWIVTLCDECNVKRNEEIARRNEALAEMRKISDELGEYE